MNQNFVIRECRQTDLPALGRFFQTAYGADSVFQSPEFLGWYFARPELPEGIESLIAVGPDGEVVSHHGGQPAEMILNGRVVSFVWAASAFTLEAWRGGGAGRQLAEWMRRRFDVVGIIGFTAKTSEFYARGHFHIFDHRRYDRFAVPLTEGTYQIGEHIGRDPELLRARLPLHTAPITGIGEVQSLGVDSLETLAWEPPVAAQATTRRDVKHLRHRFFENRFMHYRCLAVVAGGRVLAAVFTRLERMYPTTLLVDRIVDIFGYPERLPELLRAVIQRGREEGSAFVDGVTFGGLYDSAFTEAGYLTLREDDAAFLPQVTAPIEARTNLERIGLFSHPFADEIASLQQVHFTRADSDRDRVARIWQLHEPPLR